MSPTVIFQRFATALGLVCQQKLTRQIRQFQRDIDIVIKVNSEVELPYWIDFWIELCIDPDIHRILSKSRRQYGNLTFKFGVELRIRFEHNVSKSDGFRLPTNESIFIPTVFQVLYLPTLFEHNN